MNTNQKKLKLVMEGIKTSTLNKMTDSQVDILFSKLQEQITPVSEPAKTAYKIGNEGGNLPATPKGYKMKKNPDGTFMAMPNEEDNTLNVVKDPDATEDGMGMFEEKEIDEKFESKKQQKYFFAKCGNGKTKEQKKWCKMADEFAEKTNFAKLPEKKKETKEGYQDMIGNAINKISQNKINQITPSFSVGESKIERQIMRLVEKHITPKMKKEDLLSLIEGDTKTAPAKPKVNPGTKPKHPFQPDPNKKGAPKAIKKELPSFLTFNALGLNK